MLPDDVAYETLHDHGHSYQCQWQNVVKRGVQNLLDNKKQQQFLHYIVIIYLIKKNLPNYLSTGSSSQPNWPGSRRCSSRRVLSRSRRSPIVEWQTASPRQCHIALAVDMGLPISRIKNFNILLAKNCKKNKSYGAAAKSRMIPAENGVALAQRRGHHSGLVKRAISLASDDQNPTIASPV